MSYGDHWDEPARCSMCGQERGTHDDGECTAAQARTRLFLAQRVKRDNLITEEHVHHLQAKDGSWLCLDIIRLNGGVTSVQWYDTKDFVGDRQEF